MPRLRSAGSRSTPSLSVNTGLPAMWMLPASGRASPAMSLSNVDLPQPAGAQNCQETPGGDVKVVDRQFELIATAPGWQRISGGFGPRSWSSRWIQRPHDAQCKHCHHQRDERRDDTNHRRHFRMLRWTDIGMSGSVASSHPVGQEESTTKRPLWRLKRPAEKRPLWWAQSWAP